MKQQEKFSWHKRLKAFKYAKDGAGELVRYEHNFRIHLCAAIIAIALGCIFNISAVEWSLVILCIGLTFCAEALNSAIEVVCDRITENEDAAIKKAKDISAAGVTFIALADLIIGFIIFLPKFLNFQS